MGQDNRLEEVEINISYIEETLDALNKVLCKQDAEIQDLRKKFDLMADKVSLMRQSREVSTENIPHEKPPHY